MFRPQCFVFFRVKTRASQSNIDRISFTFKLVPVNCESHMLQPAEKPSLHYTNHISQQMVKGNQFMHISQQMVKGNQFMPAPSPLGCHGLLHIRIYVYVHRCTQVGEHHRNMTQPPTRLHYFPPQKLQQSTSVLMYTTSTELLLGTETTRVSQCQPLRIVPSPPSSLPLLVTPPLLDQL